MQTLMNESVKSFKMGDELYEKPDCLWLIIDGVVKSYTVDRQGKTIILGFWGKQELVSKSLSSIDPYFLQCAKDVKASVIPLSQARIYSDLLLARIEQIQQLSYIVQEPQIKNRVWLLLKWLADKFGREVEGGKLIDFELTVQELADSVGIDRIVASQAIEILEREGLVFSSQTQHIILKN